MRAPRQLHRPMNGPGLEGAPRWRTAVSSAVFTGRWEHLPRQTTLEVAQVRPRGPTKAAISGFSVAKFMRSITTTCGCSTPRRLSGYGWAGAMRTCPELRAVSLECMAHWERLPSETPQEADRARSPGPLGAPPAFIEDQAKTSIFPLSYAKVPFDNPQRYPFCSLRTGDTPVTGKGHRNLRKCTGQITVSGYSEPIVPASHPGVTFRPTNRFATARVSSGFGRRTMARTLIPNAGGWSPHRELPIKNGTKESFRQIGFCGIISQPVWTLQLRVAR